jgi:hypothetical protein
MMKRLLGAWFLVQLASGCGGTDARFAAGTSSTADAGPGPCAAGSERCGCYGNDTCDAGLSCASGLCVKLDALGRAGANGSGGSVANGTGGAGSGGSGGIPVSSGGVGSAGGTPSSGGQGSGGVGVTTITDGGTSGGPPPSVTFGGYTWEGECAICYPSAYALWNPPASCLTGQFGFMCPEKCVPPPSLVPVTGPQCSDSAKSCTEPNCPAVPFPHAPTQNAQFWCCPKP